MRKLLWIALLTVLFCFTTACQNRAAMAELEQGKARSAAEDQNKALAARFMDAYQKGDYAAIRDICSPAFVEHGAGQTRSLDQTIELGKSNLAIFSDFTIIAEHMIAEGDKVAVRYRLKVTHTGEGLGIPATGKKAETTGVEILRFENGKIAEAWAEENVLSLLMQLGFELKPKEEEKKEIRDDHPDRQNAR
jgi:predicted ester cyclase